MRAYRIGARCCAPVTLRNGCHNRLSQFLGSDRAQPLTRAAGDYFAALKRDGTTDAMRERMLDFDGLNGVLGTADMLARGIWGVPSFRVDESPLLWGQDRLWMLEEDLIAALRE